ncbi:protein NLRC3-like [Sinocyclocheilus anshuiensis]|uniref:protein NLRC3-like n=1 Tax=Sinocyclocheilus anshuiensis TaxID=1608454 RepID=UPI0007B7C55D|nr:PREDICTED: protein NLRC3-like [Sinocyclocheilus anshuiensis]
MNLYEEREKDDVHYQNKRAAPPEPSCVSMRSDQSMPHPLHFSAGSVTFNPSDTENKRAASPEPSCVSMRSERSMPHPLHFSAGSVTFNPSDTENKRAAPPEPSCVSMRSERSMLDPHNFSDGSVTFKRRDDKTGDLQQDSHQPDDQLQRVKDQHKTCMKKKYERLFEGLKFQENESLLNRIYTQDFMFVLPFRELNLIRDHQYSLHRLLLDFHPELQNLDSLIYEECKVVFIFDGLDESRITLMFSDTQNVCDVTETSSVAVLMSKLMKGELLPSALIWITSRPAATHQIPSEYINRLTEIDGFNDPQKEEYFRKRISDQHQASRIISHIRRARSLHIMCHIPVFCWISSTVLQKLLEEDLSAEIPQTLTEMYIHFLLIQINIRNQNPTEK